MGLDVNYLAVVVAAVGSMVLGGLWYGPIFGKKWAALSGMTSDKMAEAKARGESMTKSYVLMFIGCLLMAYVFTHFIGYSSGFLQESGLSVGLSAAIWAWLGFIAPVTVGKVLWEGKPWKLWILESGYYLASLLLMGLILSSWM